MGIYLVPASVVNVVLILSRGCLVGFDKAQSGLLVDSLRHIHARERGVISLRSYIDSHNRSLAASSLSL